MFKTVEHAKVFGGEANAASLRQKQVRTWNESGICIKSGNIYLDIVICPTVKTKLRGIVVRNNNCINYIQHIQLY